MKIIEVNRKWIFIGVALVIAMIAMLLSVEEEVDRVEIIREQEEEEEEVVEQNQGKENMGEEILQEGVEETSQILPDATEHEDWDIATDQEFFIEYRLERDRVRSKEIERMTELMENPEVSEESQNKAEQQLLSTIEVMEKEMVVENLVRAHGFEDAIFFFREGIANIVVKTDSLSEAEVIQVAEIVSENTDVPLSNVKVIENK